MLLAVDMYSYVKGYKKYGLSGYNIQPMGITYVKGLKRTMLLAVDMYSYVKGCRKYGLCGHNIQPIGRSWSRGQIFHTFTFMKKESIEKKIKQCIYMKCMCSILMVFSLVGGLKKSQESS